MKQALLKLSRGHGCVWLFSTLVLVYAAATAATSIQSCLTLCDPIDGSPPSSSIPGILQARTLVWFAISFSNAWKWKVKVKSLSCAGLLATPWTAAYQAPQFVGFFQARVLKVKVQREQVTTQFFFFFFSMIEKNETLKGFKDYWPLRWKIRWGIGVHNMEFTTTVLW